MIQMKFYRIFDKNRKNTLTKLYDNFEQKNVEIINNNIICIYYDYNKINLKTIERKLKNIDIDEFLITNEVFYNIIKIAIQEEYIIQSIKLTEVFEASQEFINFCLDRINYKHESNVVDRLIYELKWASSEEDVSIKEIALRINNNKFSTYVQINNNGVILLDDNEVWEIIKGMMLKSLY